MTQTTSRSSLTDLSTNAARAMPPDAFPSKLAEGRQRFLSQLVSQSLTSGLRTAKDFIRHFPAPEIMKSLADHARLRANIIVPTIGVNEKVALKKSAESAGEDLQIALEEGVTDAESVVALFDADDRVRFLDDKKLWAFVVEAQFWKVDATSARELDLARRYIAFMLDCARANRLLDDASIVDGLTIEKIVDCLPKATLATLLKGAVSDGRSGKAFKDSRMLEILTPVALLEHIPLAYVWDTVVAPKIAVAHRYQAAEASVAASASASDRATAAPAAAAPAAAEMPAAPASLSPVVEEGATDVTFESFEDVEPVKSTPKEDSARPGPHKSKRLGAIDLSDLSPEASAVLPPIAAPQKR
jgi:hypothetical protein